MENLLMISTLFFPMAALAAPGQDASQSAWRVYVVTYTGGSSEGIYVMEFDSGTGALLEPRLAAAMENPSFLTVHPEMRVLYAVGEAGAAGGVVSAYQIDSATGALTLINSQPSLGDGPCHVAVSPLAKHVAVANYGGGSISLYPITAGGGLEKSSAFVQHEGSGPDPKRQEGPHAHAVYFDAAGHYLYVADLGLDKVMIYDYDAEAGSLTPHDPPFVSLDAGAGPRHVAFHPRGFAYVVNEMGNTVSAFAHDASKAVWTLIESVSTLPAGYNTYSTTAEIEVHRSGRFLYASNRGHDSIAVFGVDEKTGKLTAIEHTLTEGKTPRHFALDPSGGYMLVANQESDSVVVFRVDAERGTLAATEQRVEVGAPVCLVFVPKGK